MFFSASVLSFLLLMTFLASPSVSRGAYITVGSDVVPSLQATGLVEKFISMGAMRSEDATLIEISEENLHAVAGFIHHNFDRCGGFVYHDSLEEALSYVEEDARGVIPAFVDYSIDQNHVLGSMIEQVDEFQIRSVIQKLSSFKNRTYNSPTGVEAAHWLANHWRGILRHRSDAEVILFEHKKWDQPSVVATIRGQSDRAVIIGGHLDSIHWRIPGLLKGSRAPGADDNASGIATFTEVMRILVQNNYTPENTLVFMGYAAEEVGLRGSKEIAKSYKKKGVEVMGVMQLDMTNFKGSDTIINLLDDYTDASQNRFLGELIETYLDVTWGYTRCGYACSDHASWTNAGFAASTPFESKKRGMNKKIHTPKDTLEVSGGHAEHATHFAKLGLAYMVELDR